MGQRDEGRNHGRPAQGQYADHASNKEHVWNTGRRECQRMDAKQPGGKGIPLPHRGKAVLPVRGRLAPERYAAIKAAQNYRRQAQPQPFQHGLIPASKPADDRADAENEQDGGIKENTTGGQAKKEPHDSAEHHAHTRHDFTADPDRRARPAALPAARR
jgi:hypothetical protein